MEFGHADVLFEVLGLKRENDEVLHRKKNKPKIRGKSERNEQNFVQQ